jgi:hypothetical protein
VNFLGGDICALIEKLTIPPTSRGMKMNSGIKDPLVSDEGKFGEEEVSWHPSVTQTDSP